jgi:hypothetical protein
MLSKKYSIGSRLRHPFFWKINLKLTCISNLCYQVNIIKNIVEVIIPTNDRYRIHHIFVFFNRVGPKDPKAQLIKSGGVTTYNTDHKISEITTKS